MVYSKDIGRIVLLITPFQYEDARNNIGQAHYNIAFMLHSTPLSCYICVMNIDSVILNLFMIFSKTPSKIISFEDPIVSNVFFNDYSVTQY